MPQELVWAAVVIGLVFLGIVRPKWLATLLIVLLAIAITGFIGFFVLVIVGKLFGGSGKK